MNLLGKNLVTLRKRMGLKQEELQEKTGIKRNTWSNWERGVSEPDIDNLKFLAQFFGITLGDLIEADLEAHPLPTGKAQKNQGKSAPKSTPNSTPKPEISMVPKVVTVDSSGNDNVVMVPIRARAGYLLGYEDPEYIQSLPAYRLPGLSHGTFRMFEVAGHSMVPTFHESDILIGRYVENFAEIRDDRVYIVVTKQDGLVCKRVINRVSIEGKLILNSDNRRHPDEYPPIVVNPEDVVEIWYAVAFMSRQMKKPGEMYTRLINVESRLTLLEDEHRKAVR